VGGRARKQQAFVTVVLTPIAVGNFSDPFLDVIERVPDLPGDTVSTLAAIDDSNGNR
jgi:hypothetical protein